MRIARIRANLSEATHAIRYRVLKKRVCEILSRPPHRRQAITTVKTPPFSRCAPAMVGKRISSARNTTLNNQHREQCASKPPRPPSEPQAVGLHEAGVLNVQETPRRTRRRCVWRGVSNASCGGPRRGPTAVCGGALGGYPSTEPHSISANFAAKSQYFSIALAAKFAVFACEHWLMVWLNWVHWPYWDHWDHWAYWPHWLFIKFCRCQLGE